jgi:hypothetical protein
MSIPVLSDQDFGNNQRITNLPPASAPGQPVVYEQLNGVASADIVLGLPPGQHHEYILSAPEVMPNQSVKAWLGSTEENELWQMEGVLINAECQVGQIVFLVSCQYFESGLIRINYEVK